MNAKTVDSSERIVEHPNTQELAHTSIILF